jgi:hypothetical protein
MSACADGFLPQEGVCQVAEIHEAREQLKPRSASAASRDWAYRFPGSGVYPLIPPPLIQMGRMSDPPPYSSATGSRSMAMRSSALPPPPTLYFSKK